MIGRLVELFEGPEAPAPWAPPAMPAALHALLPWRAFDEGSELYVNAASIGFVLEIPPFAGIDEETLGALAGTLADAAPERCTVQAIHWASPRFGAALDAWAEPRRSAGGALAAMGARRARMLAHAGWRALHPGGPPYTLADYRAFVCASLAGPPGPAAETELGAFRRALEGTLAAAGAEHAAPRARRAAGAGRRARGARHGRGARRRARAPAPALVAPRCAERAVRGPRPRPLGHAHRARLPPPGRRGRGRAGAVRRRLPRGVAGLARQRAHRRLPPRLPPARRPGADVPDGDDRRGRRRRAGVSQVRARDAAGGHGDRALLARACPRRRATGRR